VKCLHYLTHVTFPGLLDVPGGRKIKTRRPLPEWLSA